MISIIRDNKTVEVPVRSQTPVEVIQLRSTVRRAMNGTVYSHAHPSNKVKLVYGLDGLDQIKAHQLLTYLESLKDVTITIVDPAVNKKWRGVLIDFPIRCVEKGVDNCEINFTFYGEQV